MEGEKLSKLCAIIIVAFPFFGISFAQNKFQERNLYPDGHGGEVYFLLGDISFGEEVASFKKTTLQLLKKIVTQKMP